MGMMFEAYDAQIEKLDNFLSEKGFECHFNYERFPMTLEVTPIQMPTVETASGDGEDDEANNAPARLTLFFDVNRIDIKCEGNISISEKALNKIKNLGKNAYTTFVQCYFSANALLGKRIERIEGLERQLSEL